MGIDSDTIHRAQAGDREALGELIVAHQSYVYSIALGVMKHPADAADMTQEAFIRVVRALGSYRHETRFSTWLYRLATNVCLDELRRRKGQTEPMSGPWDGEDEAPADRLPDRDRWAQPEEHVALRESAAEVRGALDQLAPLQRLALTLHYFRELTDREIAEVMGVPVNTVKSHIHRGKARLAQLLAAPPDQHAATAPIQPAPLRPRPLSPWERVRGTSAARSSGLVTHPAFAVQAA